MSSKLVFEVSYGGRFDWSSGCEYMGGEVTVHSDSYDLDHLSFLELKDICKSFGYKGNEEEGRVDYNDPWWKDKVSDDDDLFHVDSDVGDSRAGTSGAVTSGARNGTIGDGDGDGDNENEGDKEKSGDVEEDDEEECDEEDGNHDEAHPSSDGVRSESGPKNKKKFEELDDDETNLEKPRSDILESPPSSDEEDEIPSAKTPEFH
ncbi:uncharacterized protein LOC132185264 [Corylus avellana]|uniref:uncharacterized protein LOC132185264 n=1 Tax=Corylus avellana TaxID=13451 RepID=UPI00286B5323|nr:uncharacterized protein LOC132185264 [Corylus avellana]